MYACAHNIDDLYHTGPIDPPRMVKIVCIVCAYNINIMYAHNLYTGYILLLDSRKAWAANIAIEWLPLTSSSIILNLKVKIKNPARSFFYFCSILHAHIKIIV